MVLAAQGAVALENSRLYAELRTALATVEESQQRIIQNERLRALGEMAGGVAHDFNNVLAVVVGRAQLLQRQVERRICAGSSRSSSRSPRMAPRRSAASRSSRGCAGRGPGSAWT